MTKKKELPLLVLNRNYTLTSTKGHSIAFVKDKPTLVPAALYQEALAIGALPENGEIDMLDDDKKEQAPMDPAERNPLILAAIEELVERNERGDFTAAGAPTVEAIVKIVGFKVQSKEIATVWQEYHEKKAEQ